MFNNSLKKLALKLEIPWSQNEEQDWGLIYGSAERWKDFISFFMNNYCTFSNTEKYALVDLIFASVNDKLVQETLSTRDIQLFYEWLIYIQKEPFFNLKLEYWSNLPDNEEFKISHLIRDLLKH